MELNDIKKSLYIEKPDANLVMIRDGNVHYSTVLNNNTVVLFKVPMEETHGASFFSVMSSKILIRWIDSFVSND